jgi:hypothetical protein
MTAESDVLAVQYTTAELTAAVEEAHVHDRQVAAQMSRTRWSAPACGFQVPAQLPRTGYRSARSRSSPETLPARGPPERSVLDSERGLGRH